MSIQVKRTDGTFKNDISPSQPSAFAMAQLLDQGTFCLQLDAIGPWGITVVTWADNSINSDRFEVSNSPILADDSTKATARSLLDSERTFAHARRLARELLQVEPGSEEATKYSVLLQHDQWFWGDPVVVIVTSTHQFVCLPTFMKPIDSPLIIPREPSLNIAVITFTEQDQLVQDVNATIPFLGFLMEFAGNGHTVWVFDGDAKMMDAGCRDADLLLVDGGKIPYLSPDWQEHASRSMRGRDLWVHDRERYALTKTTIGFFGRVVDRTFQTVDFLPIRSSDEVAGPSATMSAEFDNDDGL